MTIAPEIQERIDAIDATIKARKHAVRAGVATSKTDLSLLEKQGIESLLSIMEDTLDSHVDDDEKVTAIVTDLARLLADSPLLAKVLSGYEMEWRVFDEGRVDGSVGRAIDAVVETFRPYWEPKLTRF